MITKNVLIILSETISNIFIMSFPVKIFYNCISWKNSFIYFGVKHRNISFISTNTIQTINLAYTAPSNQAIGLINRVFANGSGYQGSITCRVIPKTQKVVFEAALLNIQHYKVKCSKPENGVALSRTPRYICY